MNGTNYISGIFKILEIPKQKNFNNNAFVTQLRAQVSQRRGTKIVSLRFWGKLSNDISTNYKINDYILIEGYLSFRNKKTENLIPSKSEKIEINVLKLYPFHSFSVKKDFEI